jgi:hypothetical protein
LRDYENWLSTVLSWGQNALLAFVVHQLCSPRLGLVVKEIRSKGPSLEVDCEGS